MIFVSTIRAEEPIIKTEMAFWCCALVFLAAGIVIKFLNADALHRSVPVAMVTVRVNGAVRFPGEYRLPAQSTWKDVFSQCGGIITAGFLPRDFDLNAPVTADQSIMIPHRLSWEKTGYETRE
ncbi:MAG: SLBB domain-containing protein [Spirochaetes bacterium]|nr:SLBB domain-containing protein [Spirochaetota bacterium]